MLDDTTKKTNDKTFVKSNQDGGCENQQFLDFRDEKHAGIVPSPVMTTTAQLFQHMISISV